MDSAVLIRAFLASGHHAPSTQAAYAADLHDLARFADRQFEDAVAELLISEYVARRFLADYRAELESRSLDYNTIKRRLGTVRRLIAFAQQEGVIAWHAWEEKAGSGELDVPYFLPHIPEEALRLDLQHYALREAIGRNYLAPIGSPTRILDVGSGSGRWAFDMCEAFPDAEVHGLDLVSGPAEVPANYVHVKADLLKGLPFMTGEFDFVHQRYLGLGIPVSRWPGVVAELVRVTRPGGWVELVEHPWLGGLAPIPPGSALERISDLWKPLFAGRALDDPDSTVFHSIDSWLRAAGLRGVNRREVKAPVGEHGGRVGSLSATILRETFARTLESEAFAKAIAELPRETRKALNPPATVEEQRLLLRRVKDELEELKAHGTIGIAFGRRPPAHSPAAHRRRSSGAG
jgi:SAM-dependent methyltransferase